MLFTATDFLYFFLPSTMLLYFFSQGRFGKKSYSLELLLLCSLFFYAHWNPRYLPLLLGSIFFNFFWAQFSHRKKGAHALLLLGIGINLFFLFYFKYQSFVFSNLNLLLGTKLDTSQGPLPLAISFFTFQQIIYLLDQFKEKGERFSFLEYANAVTFFPHLIAGPLVQYREIVPQFKKPLNRFPKKENLEKGLFLFIMGLGKKLLIADTLSQWVIKGFDQNPNLPLVHAWLVAYGYSFQLYFDFSGYSDMAVGLALLFNIQLPFNFSAPYKSFNIQEFWRRWHITLGLFLKESIYLPLGGNHHGIVRTCLNTFVVFLLGGIWHGAGWPFFIWGALHGCAMIVFLVWRRIGFCLPKLISWFITFHFVTLAWVFFRATSLEGALDIFESLAGQNGIVLPGAFLPVFGTVLDIKYGQFFSPFYGTLLSYSFILASFFMAACLALFFPSSLEITMRFRPRKRYAIAAGVLLFCCLLVVESQENLSKFLYFTF